MGFWGSREKSPKRLASTFLKKEATLLSEIHPYDRIMCIAASALGRHFNIMIEYEYLPVEKAKEMLNDFDRLSTLRNALRYISENPRDVEMISADRYSKALDRVAQRYRSIEEGFGNERKIEAQMRGEMTLTKDPEDEEVVKLGERIVDSEYFRRANEGFAKVFETMQEDFDVLLEQLQQWYEKRQRREGRGGR